MSYQRGNQQLETVARLGSVIVGSTVGLTASFFGALSLLASAGAGVSSRLPLYVLALAASFVAVVILLEDEGKDGETILVSATGLSAVTFTFVGLASEGLVFAIRNPGQALSSQLLAYVFSAGLIATALGFWFANHRDEFDLGRSSRPSAGSLKQSFTKRSRSRSRSKTRSDGGRDRL